MVNLELNPTEKAWKEFLNKEEHLIFHTLKYKKFIEEAFGCQYTFVSVVDNETIQTTIPMVKIKSKLFDNKIISSAYLEYGGFAGKTEFVKEMVNAIDKKYKNNFNFLEIRGGLEKFDPILSKKMIKKNLYKRFVLKLDQEEKVWKNIQKSKRKAIKKALKSLEIKEVPITDLNKLYHLYLKNMRQFGSPPYSKKYFLSFYENMVNNNLGKIYGAYYQGKLISALVGFCYQDRVHIIIAISDNNYKQFRPNDAVHWTFIKWACNNDYQFFDFGRVREESGQFEYKRKWGPELLELPSYFLLWQTREIPVVDPSQYASLVKLWTLMPLWLTRLVGMTLRKKLGI